MFSFKFFLIMACIIAGLILALGILIKVIFWKNRYVIKEYNKRSINRKKAVDEVKNNVNEIYTTKSKDDSLNDRIKRANKLQDLGSNRNSKGKRGRF